LRKDLRAVVHNDALQQSSDLLMARFARFI
jgi:hypothetical protein